MNEKKNDLAAFVVAKLFLGFFFLFDAKFIKLSKELKKFGKMNIN